MRVVGLQEYGGPEVLGVFEVDEPAVGPGQVLIRVRTAAVNPTDILFRDGVMSTRMGDALPPYVPGYDLAGVIEELGLDVDDRLHVGQQVVAIVMPTAPFLMGAYAEKVVVSAASVGPMPKGYNFAAASTLVMNALTARNALDGLGLSAGATIAVTGGAGTVGGYAIQLARQDGFTVIADALPADEASVLEHGAHHLVRRGDDVAEQILALMPGGVDGVVDAALLRDAIVPAIVDGGTIAELRGWTGPVDRDITIHRIRISQLLERTDLILRLIEQVDIGVLTLHVADTLPASSAADAHRRLEAGGVRGRLVLDFTRFEGR